LDLPYIPNLRLRTSRWSSEDRVGNVHPPGTPTGEIISTYAEHFDTVEIDSTFYRIPNAGAVENWRHSPPGFLFTAKSARIITHDKVFRDCQSEVKEFLSVMDLLGDKLDPLLLQFPYFNKQTFAGGEDFYVRLPEALRSRGIAFALLHHPWITTVRQLPHGGM
jgi:uncharacterized protein YecE (DUF72 family)